MRRLEKGTRIVVASHNKGKVWEINELLTPYGLDAVSAASLGLAEPAETETTFRGNALIKAKAAAEGSGLPALADDSGLEIEALGGAPGVYSADWAGPGRDFGLAMARVNTELERRGAWKAGAAPRANFISVLCLRWPDGDHAFFEGRVDGTLVWPPRGGNGFGYDPMFIANGETQTFGEIEPKQKYAISHRTRAFAEFRAQCLERIAATEPGGPVDDVAAIGAAAACLSSQEELVEFISRMRANLRDRPVPRARSMLGDFLAALEGAAAHLKPTDEPRWRTIAKLLAAGFVPAAEERDSQPTSNRLYFLEDLEPGQKFVSARRALQLSELKDFARTFDPQPFHLDEQAARGTLFGSLAAGGWHTAALTMRLNVDGGLPLSGGLIGAEVELSWPIPTRPGDVLQVENEIIEIVPSRSRPDRGMVKVRSTTRNASGEVVQVMTGKMIVPRRPGFAQGT